jgi:hypothetical protein
MRKQLPRPQWKRRKLRPGGRRLLGKRAPAIESALALAPGPILLWGPAIDYQYVAIIRPAKRLSFWRWSGVPAG